MFTINLGLGSLSTVFYVMLGMVVGLGIGLAFYYTRRGGESDILRGFLLILFMPDQRVMLLQLRSSVAPNLYLAVRNGWQYVVRVNPEHILTHQLGGRIAFAVGNSIMGSQGVRIVTGASLDPSLAIDVDLYTRFHGAAGEGVIHGVEDVLDAVKMAREGVVDVQLTDPMYGATIAYTIDAKKLAAHLLRASSDVMTDISQSFAYVTAIAQSLSKAVKSLAAGEAMKAQSRARLIYAVGIIAIIAFTVIYALLIK